MTTCPDCGKPLYEDSIHSCFPLALYLAEQIEAVYEDERMLPLKAAAELRRLHAENEALREQNKEFRDVLAAACDSLGAFVSDHGWSDLDMQIFDNVCAVLARAGEMK